jgi:hypothetical protein
MSWQIDAIALFDGRVEERVGSRQGHRQLAGGKRCSRLALSVSFPLHDESLQGYNQHWSLELRAHKPTDVINRVIPQQSTGDIRGSVNIKLIPYQDI